MGMDIDARLMYGLFYEDIVKDMTDAEIDLLDNEIDNGVLDTASPWYDAQRIDWFIGYQMGECFDLDTVDTFIADLKECESKFKVRFGMTGQVMAAKDVT